MSKANSRPVALVTGSSSGIGLAASIELARLGHRVFASMRSAARSGELETAARESGVEVEVVELDVTSRASIEAAIAQIEARAGRIDVLVNNAGIAIRGFFEEIAPDELREVFDTNFFGVTAVTSAVLPGMRQRRHGRIINVSSMSPHLPLPTMSAYAASKAAMEAMTEVLHHELRPVGVHAIYVVLGAFDTTMSEGYGRFARASADPSAPTHAASRFMAETMNRRIGRVKEPARNAARVVAQAATAPRPKLKYYAGRAAIVASTVLSVVPSGVMQSMLARIFNPPQ